MRTTHWQRVSVTCLQVCDSKCEGRLHWHLCCVWRSSASRGFNYAIAHRNARVRGRSRRGRKHMRSVWFSSIPPRPASKWWQRVTTGQQHTKRCEHDCATFAKHIGFMRRFDRQTCGTPANNFINVYQGLVLSQSTYGAIVAYVDACAQKRSPGGVFWFG